jgi:hypothetical protein
MSKSKDQFEVNSHLEHLFWKRDLESMDLMKLHGQEHDEVTSEINHYLYELPAELTLEFFNKDEEKFSAYKEAQDYFNSADFEKDLMKDYNDSKRDGTLTSDGYYHTYYQPVIHTKLIDNILKEFNLKDTRQNRYCIAMVERKESQMCSDYHWNDEILNSRVRQIVVDLKSTNVLDVILLEHEDYGMYTDEGNRKVHQLVTTSKSLEEALRGLRSCGDEAGDTIVRENVMRRFPNDNSSLSSLEMEMGGSASLNSMQGMRAEAEAIEHGNKNQKTK